MVSSEKQKQTSIFESAAPHILLDIGIVLSILCLPNHYWAEIGAAHLQPHLFMLSFALFLVYGTAIARGERRLRYLVERTFSLLFILATGWMSDGAINAFLRFAFLEIIALSIGLGCGLVLYRVVFDVFSEETRLQKGLTRYLSMFREYWTDGAVLPIIIFGFPLLAWSGVALKSIYFDFVEQGLGIMIIGFVSLGFQIHARWETIFSFLERSLTGEGD